MRHAIKQYRFHFNFLDFEFTNRGEMEHGDSGYYCKEGTKMS